MMALDKLENVSKQNFAFNQMPIAKEGVGNYSATSVIQNKDLIFYPRSNYVAENKIEKNELTKTKPEEEKISVFITDDKDLLDQYYNLRNDIFRNEKGWTNHIWLENDFDRNSKIAVAVDESGVVVGGLRIMSSTNNDYLSDEFPGTEFTYPNLFEKLGLNKKLGYIEVDGAVVKKEYRNRETSIKMAKIATEYGESCGCAYLVGIAPPITLRNDRVVLKSLGYKDIMIVKSFPWKELEIYNNSVDYPIVAILTSKQ